MKVTDFSAFGIKVYTVVSQEPGDKADEVWEKARGLARERKLRITDIKKRRNRYALPEFHVPFAKAS